MNCQLYTEWILRGNEHPVLLCFRKRSHRVANVNRQLADVHEGVLVGRYRIHCIQLRDAVPHHDKPLVCEVGVLFALSHERQIDHLRMNG